MVVQGEAASGKPLGPREKKRAGEVAVGPERRLPKSKLHPLGEFVLGLHLSHSFQIIDYLL